jgi:phenylpropionate dioxygenase-like ring-hydroxylating dioxygenase large terminal subunit
MGKRYDFPIPFGWYAVSLSRDLAVGEVKPLHYLGKELVLFRTESGEAKLLDAYCPHLGAHIGHGGKVKGEHVACPFHGWEFNGEGVCKHIPYAKNMPPRADGKQTLHAYPVQEQNSVVWAWYHPDCVAPLFELDVVPEVGDPGWTDFRVYEWTINTVIQEAAENAADAAHFVYVHTAKDIPRGEITHEGHRRFARYVGKTADMDENGQIDTTGTRWRETRVMFGREATETLEITEWRPPREYVVSADSHGCRYRSVIRVRPQGPGTVIEFEFGGEPYTFMSRATAFVMGGLMRGSIEKMLRTDLAAMKDFCERHA